MWLICVSQNQEGNPLWEWGRVRIMHIYAFKIVLMLRNAAYVCSHLLSSLVSLRNAEATFHRYKVISIKDDSKQNAAVVFEKKAFYLWKIRQMILFVIQKPTEIERRWSAKSCLTTSFVWNESANGIEACFNSDGDRHQQEQDQDKKSQC